MGGGGWWMRERAGGVQGWGCEGGGEGGSLGV